MTLVKSFALFAAILVSLSLSAKPPDSGALARRLGAAVDAGSLRQVKQCLAEGADPNLLVPDPWMVSRDRQRTGAAALDFPTNALHRAMWQAPDMVRLLLKAGARCEETTGSGHVSIPGWGEGASALLLAAGQGALAAAEILLVEAHANVDAMDSTGTTPLLRALYGPAPQRPAMLRLLLAHGARTEGISGRRGPQDALVLAVAIGDPELVRILLRTPTGADTAFAGVLASPDGALLKVFLEERPGLANYPVAGHYALEIAAWAGNEAACTLLLNVPGRRPRAEVYAGGFTPLHHAAGGGHCGIIDRLLEAEPGWLEAQDALGRTPLFWAAEAGRTQAVRHLLEAYRRRSGTGAYLPRGLEPLRRDHRGWNPAFMAERNGHAATLAALADVRFDVGPCDAGVIGIRILPQKLEAVARTRAD